MSKTKCLFIALQIAGVELNIDPNARATDQLPPVLPSVEDSRLIEVASLAAHCEWCDAAPDGRVFISHPQVEEPGAQVSELKNGEPVAYPDVEMNLWKPDGDSTRTFMKVNSLRVGP